MVNEFRHHDSLTSSRRFALTLHHLRYAVAAADHGSFRQAAEASLVRQSTLSRSIRQLEESIEMTLFDRSSGGVQPTPTGREFLRSARSILEQMDALLSIAQSTGRGEIGHLIVGFDSSLSTGNLRATLVEFSNRRPQVNVGMVERSRTRLTTALRNRAIDIAIVASEPSHLNGRSMRLWRERVMVVLPETHRLASENVFSWSDLGGETIILSERDPGPEFETRLAMIFASRVDAPKIIRHDIGRSSIESLVVAGRGISLMTEASASAARGGAIYLELRDQSGPILIRYSAHWRDDNDNPALASFVELLRELYPLPADGG